MDSKRGKIFTRHAALITLAARRGGDSLMNPGLRLAIDNAKADNVPNANIERAIKRGTGELKDGTEIAEVTYEGYGPGGVAIMVECLTDNKNRTLTNLRTIFDKHGGRLGESGSVGYLFDRKGVIELEFEPSGREALELEAIDAGAEELESEENQMTIITTMAQLGFVRDKLQNFKIKQAEIRSIPKTSASIEDRGIAQKVINLLEALEEDMDVGHVSSNAEISDSVLKALEEGRE